MERLKHEVQRANRIDEIKSILNSVTKEQGAVDEKRLQAQLCLKWGLSKRKISEYISILIDSDFCIRTQKGLKTSAMIETEEILKKEEQEVLDGR